MTAFLPLAPLSDHLDRVARLEDRDGLSRAVWRDAPAAAHLLRTGRDPAAGVGPAAAALACRLAAADTGLYPRPWLDAPQNTLEGLFTHAVHSHDALRALWRALLRATGQTEPPVLNEDSRLHLALAIDSLLGDLLRYEVIQLYPYGQPVERPRPLASRRARPLFDLLRGTVQPPVARSHP